MTQNNPRLAKRAFVSTLLALGASVAFGSAAPRLEIPISAGLTDDQVSAIQSLDGAVSAAQPESAVPGMSLVLVSAEGPLWAKAYGVADADTDRPVTLDTPFGIGSISKTFIGAALMTEIEGGRVTLDHNINDVLPFEIRNPRVDGPPIQVRHIVTHTSGIQDHPKTYGGSYADGDPDPDFGAWLKSYLTPGGEHYSARGNFLKAAPGTRQEYSNIGATVGALVVEHVSGTPYRRVVEKRIFEPLGMRNTGFMIADFPADTIATPHQGRKQKTLDLFGYPTYPDGMIRSSALDLANYLQMLLDGGRFAGRRVLKEGSVETLLAEVPTEADGKPYGVYWVTDEHRAAKHSGGDPGIVAFVGLNRDRGVAFALLFNSDEIEALFKTLREPLQKALESFPLP
ncbi:MAG: serine hydrolase domain-containing protein [Acidobacteriota bacterium]